MDPPLLVNPEAPRTRTHADLVVIASRWTQTKCGVVLPEFVTMEAEIADVLGFSRQGSYMIEVKVSRNDFLRDKKKLHRAVEDRGVGNYRYYCCPKGLIGVFDIPSGWGLIWVYPSGHAKQVLRPQRKKANIEAERNILYSYARRAVVKGLHAEILRSMADDKARLIQSKEEV